MHSSACASIATPATWSRKTGVVAEPAAAGRRLVAELDQRPHRAVEAVRVVDPEHRPLVRERALRDRPAAVELAERGSRAARARR